MRKFFRKVASRLFVTATFTIIIVVIYGIWFLQPYIRFAQSRGVLSVFAYPTEALVQHKNNIVSIVVLGVPGGNYEGSFLTDSIQVLRYDLKKKDIAVISVPRDIWSTAMKDKVNAAYFYGTTVHDNPLYWLKPELQKITGIAPQYYVVINFAKFKQLIDYVGGVDIAVERGFVDKKFPIAGRENDLCGGDPEYTCRYETVTFRKGLHHMNGETALKFARSRNAEGEEGTAFARDARQQKVMQGLASAIVNPSFILSQQKFIDFIEFADTLFEKNLSMLEIAALARTYIFNKNRHEFKTIVLSDELFYVPTYEDYEGRYVLLPKKGFAHLRGYVQKKIEKD